MFSIRDAGWWTVAALLGVCGASYAQPAAFELTHKGYLATPRCGDLNPHRCTLLYAEHGSGNIFVNHETKAHPMFGWYSREPTASNPEGDRRWFNVPRFYVALEFWNNEIWKPAKWIGYGISKNSLHGDTRLKGTSWAVLFQYGTDNPEATVKLFDQGEYFWMFAALGTDQPARIALWDAETWCVYLFEKEPGPAVALTSTGDIRSSRLPDVPTWEGFGC